MNKIYKVIYCKATQTWVAVSELAKGHSKSSSVGTGRAAVSRSFQLKGLTMAVLLGLGFTSQQAMAACTITNATVGGPAQVTCGAGATAVGGRSVAIGENAKTFRPQAIAIGAGKGTAAGAQSGFKSIAIGVDAIAGSVDGTRTNNAAIAIGHKATATGDQSTALGADARANGLSSVAIGGNDLDKIANSSVGGEYNTLTGDTIVVGDYRAATAGDAATAVGTQATATGDLSTAFGVRTTASGQFASAFGVSATATKSGAVAIGANAKANAKSGVAIGTSAEVTEADGVALGSSSVADRAATAAGAATSATPTAGTTVYALGTANQTDKDAISNTVKGSLGAVSVGSATATRQITNVAAGAADTDAVNVAQLKSVANGLDEQGYFHVNDGSNSGTGDATANKGRYDEAGGATATNAIAAGIETQATAAHSIAMGTSATAGGAGENAIAIGRGAQSTNQDTIAIGQGTVANQASATAVGIGSDALGDSASAFGRDANAGAESATALGRSTRANAKWATAVGSNAYANAEGSTALGLAAEALADHSTAVGRGAKVTATGESGVAIGQNANTTGYRAVAVGQAAQATGAQGVAMGNDASATEAQATAVGFNADATGDSASAFGRDAHAKVESSTALGRHTRADGTKSTAVGAYSYAYKADTIAIGHAAEAHQDSSTALGSFADANVAHSVALGSNSQANRAATTAGATADQTQTVGSTVYALNTASTDDKNAISATVKGTLGAVSVGSDTATRQITNVAAGTADTDAVNVAQLKAVANTGFNIDADKRDGLTEADNVGLGDTVKYTSTDGTVTTTVSDNQIDLKVTTTTLADADNDGIIDTPATADATKLVNAGDVATAINKSGFKLTTSASAGDVSGTTEELINPGEVITVDAGKNIAVTQAGNKITVATKDDVVFNKVTSNTVVIGDATNTTTLTSGANGLDVGDDKITNVAAGTVDANSKDAVNGSQLHATNTNVTNNATNIAKGINVGGTTGSNKYALGDTINVKGDSNITSETVAGGVQLGLANSVTIGDTSDATKKPVTINGDAGTITGLSNTTFDPNATYTGGQAATQEQLQQVVGYTAGSGGFGLKAQDSNEVTKALGNTVEVVGTGADASATYSGSNLKTVVNNGKVEIQMTDRPQFGNVKVNEGGTGKITGVTAGDVSATSTDAINGSQLHAVKEMPLNFAGNTGATIAKKLSETLAVKGALADADAASASNVRVDSEGGELIIKIADNPTFAGTVTAKDVVATNGTNTIKLDSNTGTINGLTNKTWTTSQAPVDGQAATENQLKVVSDIADNANKGFNITTTASTGGEVVTPITADQVKPTDTVTFDAGKNIKLTQTDNKVSIATKDEVTFTKTTVGNVVTDSATNKITGLEKGDVTATSKDAINGSQLHNTNDTISSIIGGTNAGLNPDGTVKKPTFTTNGNTYNNVGDALKGLGDGTFSITAQDGNSVAKTLNNTIEVVGGASASASAVNTKTVVKNGKIEVQIVDAPTFKEITLGDATNNTKLTSTDKGLDVGGDQITNVASAGDITDAANAKNAVNAGDLNTAINNTSNALTAKGLDFGGNEGAKVHRDLGTQLNVLGGASTAGTYSGANVKTVTDPTNGAINVQIADAPVFAGKVSAKGLDAGGEKITNVKAGENGLDAVNYDQLKALADKVTNVNSNIVTLEGNSPFTFMSDDGNKTQLVRVKDASTGAYTFYKPSDLDSNNNPKAGATPYTGNVVTSALNSATDTAAPQRIVNVGVGKDPTDAVNVSQLKGAVNALGGGADVNPDGSIKAPTYTINKTDGSTTTAGNVGDALTSLNNEVIKPITFTGDIGSSAQKLGSTFAVIAGNATDTETTNLKTTVTDGKVEISMAKAPTFAGKVTAKGFDATDNKIENVAAGDVSATSKDAINGSQLHAVSDANKNIFGGNATVNPNGTVTMSNVGGTGESNIHDAIKSINTTAGKGFNLTAQGANSSNVKPGETVDLNNTDGNITVVKKADEDKVTFDLAKDITVDSVTAGDSKLTNEGLTITGGPSVTKAGINAADKKVTGVAAGDVTANSTDAINGSQLHQITGDMTANYINQHGAGIKYFRANSTGSDASATGADAVAMGKDAIAKADQSVALGANSVATARDANQVKGYVPEAIEVPNPQNPSNPGMFGPSQAQVAAILATQAKPNVGSVSVGDESKGIYRQITGVAAGSKDTDAVNVAQLKAVQFGVNDVIDRAVKYDLNPDGSVNYNNVTMGAGHLPASTDGGKTGGVKLSNLAQGTISENSTDSVNGAQLHAMSEANKAIFGGNATVNGDGTVTMTDVGGTGANNIHDAIKAVNTTAGKHNTVSAGTNMEVVESVNANGGKNYEVKTKSDVAFDNVNVGGVNINKDTGINAGNKQVKGVASGLGGRSISDIKAQGSSAPEWNNAATVGDLTQVQTNVATVTNIVGSSGNTQADQLAIKTYSVEGQEEKTNNTVISAIKSMNEGGIKYFHTNDTANQFTTGDTNKEDSSAGGSYSTAVGYKAKTEGAKSVALGNETLAKGASSVAIGDGSKATGNQSIAIGTGNEVTGNRSGAIGDPTYINADDSYAIGNNNNIAAGSNKVFVVGNNVNVGAGHTGAVVLGDQSTIDTVHTGNYTLGGARDAQVAGKKGAGTQVVSVGSEGNERQIQNVAPGVVDTNSTDAINGSQLYNSMANVNRNINSLYQALGDVEDTANAGTASALAAANLPQPHDPGASMVSAALGHYNGESALSVGVSTISDNGKWIIKGSLTHDTQSNTGVGVGVGYQW